MDDVHLKPVMLKAALVMAAGIGLGVAVKLGFPFHFFLVFILFAPVPILRSVWQDHKREKVRLKLEKRARLDRLYGPN